MRSTTEIHKQQKQETHSDFIYTLPVIDPKKGEKNSRNEKHVDDIQIGVK